MQETKKLSEDLEYYFEVIKRVDKIENPYIKESVYKHLFLQGVFRAWKSDMKDFYIKSIEQDLTLSGV